MSAAQRKNNRRLLQNILSDTFLPPLQNRTEYQTYGSAIISQASAILYIRHFPFLCKFHIRRTVNPSSVVIKRVSRTIYRFSYNFVRTMINCNFFFHNPTILLKEYIVKRYCITIVFPHYTTQLHYPHFSAIIFLVVLSC